MYTGMRAVLSESTATFNLNAIPKSISAELQLQLVAVFLERKLLENSDLSMACGYALLLAFPAYSQPFMAGQLESMGVFKLVWDQWSRVFPVLPPAEWWAMTAGWVPLGGKFRLRNKDA